MSQITSGKVLYSRKIQPTQFEPKHAEVEISFSVGEGEDYTAMLNVAAAAAYAKCHEMLGLKAPALPAAPTPPTTNKPAAHPAPASGPVVETAGPAEAETKRRTRKAPPATEATAAAEGIDVVGEQHAATATVAAGSTVTQTSAAAAAAKSTPKTAVSPSPSAAADPAAVEDWSAAPSEVTDEELMKRITAKNAEIKNPTAIRTLIGKYVAPPKQAREIEQSKRSAFLAELEKLQKAA